MKKSLKLRLAVVAFAVTLMVSLMAPSFSMAMNVTDLDKILGAPAKVEDIGDGSMLRYYSTPNHTGLEGFQIFEVTKAGAVVDRGFSDSVWDYFLHGGSIDATGG